MIKTKASIAKEKAESEFKVIKFEGLKKLPKTQPPTQKKQEFINSEDEEFEAIFGDGHLKKEKPKKDKNAITFDRARREVMNFGISGSNATDKSDQIQQLLIKLGAKRPKNKGRNYKEILEEKRKQKDEDNKVNKRTLFGTSASLQFRSQKKKSRHDGLLKSYGKLDKDSLKQIKNKNPMKKKR